MKYSLKIVFMLIISQIHIVTLFAQVEDQLLSVRGVIADQIPYHFAGTVEDLDFQCTGGFGLMQTAVPALENDRIEYWTANGEEFRPDAPVGHMTVCETLIASALPNEMASLDAQFRIKGIIDEEFEYDFTGNFLEVFDLAANWLAENHIDVAFIISFDGWDGNAYTLETALLWDSESLPHIMRAFAVYQEPTSVNSWEIY